MYFSEFIDWHGCVKQENSILQSKVSIESNVGLVSNIPKPVEAIQKASEVLRNKDNSHCRPVEALTNNKDSSVEKVKIMNSI